MPLYAYRAVDDNSKSISGTMYARNPQDVKEKIQSRGLVAVKIYKGSVISERVHSLLAGKMKLKHVSVLCRQLYIIVKSGVNILNGLEILRKETKNKMVRNVLRGIISEVQRGRSISEAMSDAQLYFPPLLVNMIAVGEVSGNLEEILKRMSSYYEKESYIHEKLKAAMTYPIILVIIGIALLALFTNYVLPEVMSVINEAGGELPLFTQVVLGIFEFIRTNYFAIGAVVVTFILSIKLFGKNDLLRLAKDSIVIRLPILNESIRNVVTSRFARTMAIMLKAGVPLIEALESTKKVMGNAVVESGIEKSIDGIKRGGKLGDNLASCNFFDSMIIHMLEIGEETGDLDGVLDTVADYYDKESETMMLKLMAAIEPAFTILIGSVIGLIIISLMLPMFNMLSQLEH